jgi:hypothetical protein
VYSAPPSEAIHPATGEYLIAAITASELLHGIYRAKTEAQRLARTADVENILSNRGFRS